MFYALEKKLLSKGGLKAEKTKEGGKRVTISNKYMLKKQKPFGKNESSHVSCICFVI